MLTTKCELREDQQIKILGVSAIEDRVCPVEIIVDVPNLRRKLKTSNPHRRLLDEFLPPARARGREQKNCADVPVSVFATVNTPLPTIDEKQADEGQLPKTSRDQCEEDQQGKKPSYPGSPKIVQVGPTQKPKDGTAEMQDESGLTEKVGEGRCAECEVTAAGTRPMRPAWEAGNRIGTPHRSLDGVGWCFAFTDCGQWCPYPEKIQLGSFVSRVCSSGYGSRQAGTVVSLVAIAHLGTA